MVYPVQSEDIVGLGVSLGCQPAGKQLFIWLSEVLSLKLFLGAIILFLTLERH